MIYYTINHFVTTEPSTGITTETDTALPESTVHGDDSVAIWFDVLSEYTTDEPDITIAQPETGFHWKTDMNGFTEHPPQLTPEEYVDRVQAITTDAEFEQIKQSYVNGDITRVSVWETVLTDGYTQ